MTTDELAKYYADLLITQYQNKPKAYDTVVAQVTPVLMDQVPLQIEYAFRIETAVGPQLDIIGKYVGVTRYGNTSAGPVTLIDSDFRTLIKLVILTNTKGSSLATIQDLLAKNFPGQIFVADNQNMGLNYVLISTLGTADLLEILVSGGYLPAPMGVRTTVVAIPAFSGPLFGFRTYSFADNSVAPFNSYAFYNTAYHWFKYSEAI